MPCNPVGKRRDAAARQQRDAGNSWFLRFRSLLAVVALLSGCSRVVTTPVVKLAAAPFALPTTAPAAVAEPFPTPVVELAGSPSEMGAEHADALHDPIQVLHDQYLMKFIGSPARHFLATSAANLFESRMLPEHREETLALAREMHMEPSDAVLAQCFLDLMPATACSTITLSAAASPDRIARFGRNLDFASLNIADRYTTVFIYRPLQRYAVASIGWPGLIGILSGMNERGLCLANMEVPRGPRLPSAMPYVLLYRSVLEQCGTVSEAIAMLRVTPRQTANNLMLMDATGARAVVEITPDSLAVRTADDLHALISTNQQRGYDADAAGWCRRYDSLHRASTEDYGRIDRQRLQSMMNDAAQGQYTLQSMIFEPATRTLCLATGKHASSRKFYELDLKPLFARHEPI